MISTSKEEWNEEEEFTAPPCHPETISDSTEGMKNLGQTSLLAAYRAAHSYLVAHHLMADDKVLVDCCRQWCKIKLPEAIADAREAYGCGMNQVGDQTFLASMCQAGIEAAKECSFPVEPLEEGSGKEANARLIAAAPELLAALEAALPQLPRYISDPNGERSANPVIEQARAAIAKARGE